MELLDWLICSCWIGCYAVVGLVAMQLLDWLICSCWIGCYAVARLVAMEFLDFKLNHKLFAFNI